MLRVAPVPIVAKVAGGFAETAKGNQLYREFHCEYGVKNDLCRSEHLDYVTQNKGDCRLHVNCRHSVGCLLPRKEHSKLWTRELRGQTKVIT